MADEDLYAVLNVDQDASTSEIRRAYLALAKEKHPDKGADKASFQTLLHAYEVLSDPVLRAKHDRALRRKQYAEREAYRAARAHADPFDPFDFDFSPMPAMPSFHSFPSFGFPSFPSFPPFGMGMGMGMGPGPMGMGGMPDPFRGFPFGGNFPGGHGGFPPSPPQMHARFNDHFNMLNSAFDDAFRFPTSGDDGNAVKSNSRVDVFEAFFGNDFDESRIPQPAAQPASNARDGNEQAVAAPADNRQVQAKNGGEYLQPQSRKEYVFKDKDGKTCGWGYTATWTSGDGSTTTTTSARTSL